MLRSSILLVALLGAATAHAGTRAHDFTTELALLHRVVACAPTEAAVPPAWTEVVSDHCAKLGKQTERFRTRYVDEAGPFIAALRPAGLPRTVVYPFGGGDLASALVTYADANEITTISLEHSGDPRRLATLSAAELRTALTDFRTAISGLLAQNDSATSKMQAVQRGPLPGQVGFFLTALAVLGHRPVSLRYFKIEPDGSLHYYSLSEIEALAGEKARKMRIWAVDTDHSVAFSHAELVFERAGGSRVVHRHIAANLDNANLRGSALEKHLVAKGQVATMTKAASYLLWTPGFTVIRDYLLKHSAFMISDSTGVPPHHARAAGFRQKTYGRFTGPFLPASEEHAAAFAELWRQQPYRKLGFRYGYPDSAGHFHMLIMHRSSVVTP